MSWDADLWVEIDGHPINVGHWNYTHNCSSMIYRVLDTVGYDRGTRVLNDTEYDRAWWDVMDRMGAPESVKYLDLIIGGVSEAPELFRSMNPENGWGDYDSLLRVLAEMRARAEKYPSGRWMTSG